MNGSDLVVNFIHKDLRLKDGLQICPVDQMKMTFKGMRIPMGLVMRDYLRHF